MNFKNLFNLGKKKNIRALRLEQEKNAKKKPRFSNPYFVNENKAEEEEPQNIKQFFLKKDGPAYIGIILLLLACSVYVIFGTKYFRISNINIEGNKNITQDEINNLLNNYLSTKKLYILPNNNWLIFNQEKALSILKEGIANKFVLADADITKKWPNNIKVAVTERIPGLVWISNNEYYYLDIEGMPTQKIDKVDEINKDFPMINDLNNIPVEINRAVISADLISFILSLQDKFPSTGLAIKSYSVPKITCQEVQYKMEKLIQEEIDQTANDKIKEKKKEILKKYNNGKITIEESLTLLEEVKNEENINGNTGNSNQTEIVKWESVSTPKECNYVEINSEINIVTEDGFDVYFDSKLNVDQQINNLKNLLAQKIDNKQNIQYIDLRFNDRIYYK
jgi:cell division septal protein FtsQ